ncbi:MAG: DUF4252 domain-containing protein [Bacteroides sp.]|nr:DUF4252 domain-containing protein [Bacteroides sp.]
MKQFVKTLFIALVVATMAVSCKAQKIFSEVASVDGVTSVYLSPAMCKMAKLGSMGLPADGIKDLKCVEIINCEDAQALPKVKSMCESTIGNLNAEVLTEVSDNGEQVRIYGIPASPEIPEVLSAIVIEAAEPGQYSAIHIVGTFDLEAIIASMGAQ